MTTVKPLWDAPRSVKDSFLRQYDGMYDSHSPRGYNGHEEIIQLVEGVLCSRDFDIDKDVFVTVQETHTKLGFDTADQPPEPHVASEFDAIEEAVIIVNGWAFDRLEYEYKLDVIAHELCHVQASEKHGKHDEREAAFQHLLSKRSAAQRELEVIDDPVEFWDGYPVTIPWQNF